MERELLAMVDTFEDIVEIAKDYYKDDNYNNKKWGEFGYGDQKYIGVISCGMDGGDVDINISKDTPENRQKLVDEWNEIAKKIMDEEAPWEYGCDLLDVLDNIEFYMDIKVRTSLWG